LKFRFEVNKLGADVKELCLLKSEKGLYSDDGYKMFGRDTTIKHVHQLQNLYFALTGKELELKPETNE